MKYIQKLIDAQDNIIIICDNKFQMKYINKTFYNYFKESRIVEIIELLKNTPFDEETKIKIKNYKDNKYTFLVKLTKIDDDISISLTNITKISAYQKSLLQSNATFLEYKNIINKFLIVLKTDTDGTITYVNDNFVKISNYSYSELIGKHYNVIIHPDMPKYLFEKMTNNLQEGKIWQGVLKNQTKTKNIYFVKTMISPLFNSNHKIKEYIALMVDITELIKSKEKAQKAKKSKEMFLANMSHEIRTPLTGIMGFINILKQKKLSEEIGAIIDIIDNSADTLLNIVNDILNLSKIEKEGITIYKHKFNPNENFLNTIELFKAKAKEKNIQYVYNIDVGDCIISDEHRLKQVLSNLIGNSIKFTPQNGKVEINIILKDDIIYFSIKDNGIGISKDKIDKLFKPFSQADKNIENNFGGTGLGLYISAEIVKKLGGELKVKSKIKEGSEFYFLLKAEKCILEKAKKEENIFIKGKILIAEDNKINQELIKSLLQLKGEVDITIAENGKEAIEKFKEDKFDLIFMDMLMPEIDGQTATKEILKYEKNNKITHTPIIALSAYVDEKNEFKNLFDDYLTKPINETHLDEILEKYLKVSFLKEISKSMKIDENVMKELISLYFDNIYYDLKKLKNSIKNNDYENIRFYSHKIAGSSSAVYFTKVYDLSKEIEQYAKDNKNIEYCKLFDKLYAIIQEYKTKV